jgi:hypothetical protein
MDHDQAKENWSRGTNRAPGCDCPAWRYSPRHPKPTNPDCEQHGEQHESNIPAAAA